MAVENYTPRMVREILDTDNAEISNLCREARLVPKKDYNGNTYFTKHDVNALQKLKNLHAKNKKIIDELTNVSTSLSIYNQTNEKLFVNETIEKLNVKFEEFQTAIAEKITATIDEKLDGMDEVVVELIRCKTENETLRFKMNELEKLNYNMQNQLAAYKNIGFNLYVKKEL